MVDCCHLLSPAPWACLGAQKRYLAVAFREVKRGHWCRNLKINCYDPTAILNCLKQYFPIGPLDKILALNRCLITRSTTLNYVWVSRLLQSKTDA